MSPFAGFSTRHPHLASALWVAAFALLSAVLQLQLPVWFDADTAYHAAVGRLIAQHGMLDEFPWTSFSLMRDQYADTELVFHLLFSAAAGLSPEASAMVVGTLLGTVVLSSMFFVMRAERIRNAGLWSLLPLAMSGAFVVRFLSVRPHLLAVALSVLITWAAARRRLVLLAAISFLYPWCYLGWVTALGAAAVVEIARWLEERTVDWKPVVAVSLGLAAGLLTHPNFPAVAEHAWVEISRTLFSIAWGDRGRHPIGGEFNSFSLLGNLRYVSIPALMSIAALSLALRRRSQTSVAALAFALSATIYLALTLGSQRFLEYLAPYAALAAGLASGSVSVKYVGALVAVAALFTGSVSGRLYDLVKKRDDMFPPATRMALATRIPKDAQVFTCDWQFTGEMLLALPGRRFMVALNPMLFFLKDPERYWAWIHMVRRPPEAPAKSVYHQFQSRYVLCEMRPEFGAFIQSLHEDPLTRRRFYAWPWALFEVESEPPTDRLQQE